MPESLNRIYLDFNAGTPIAPEVRTMMTTLLEEPFGNPSSSHWAGMPAKAAVEKARAQVAALLAQIRTKLSLRAAAAKPIITR